MVLRSRVSLRSSSRSTPSKRLSRSYGLTGSYIDEETGNTVHAKQAQHGGSLILVYGEFEQFEDGDWIVTFPVNFEGKQERRVIKEEAFSKRFKLLGSKKTTGIDWSQYGWG